MLKNNPEIDEFGNNFWFNEKDELHRGNGPAIEYTDGTLEYYIDGKRHREDGPAVSWPDNSLIVIQPTYIKFWYINNNKYTKEEYWKEINIMKKLKEIL